jgi:2-hydroxy-3-keto-5-methylthiopentenyl-1-phosphate phosphatase
MATKTFIEIDGLKIVSDERDIMVPEKYFNDVVEWCKENHINVTNPLGGYNKFIASRMFKVNLWRVKKPEQRLLFALRWS